MQQRYLGNSGLRVGRLGLGTMSWGRDTDEHEAREQLAAFVSAGGTLVDTAAAYGEGASERVLGSLLGDVLAREELVIATKAGFTVRGGARVTDTSRGALLRDLDASLRRLGTDYVDLWQVHTWSDDVSLTETLTALDAAVAAGKARLLAAQPQLRARAGPGRRRPRHRGAALVPARPRRADRQVPHQHPRRLPRRVRTPGQIRRPLPRRTRIGHR